jgi:hypothetical protein
MGDKAMSKTAIFYTTMLVALLIGVFGKQVIHWLMRREAQKRIQYANQIGNWPDLGELRQSVPKARDCHREGWKRAW